MPLITVVSTAVPEHEPVDIRLKDEIYTIVFGGRVTTYIDKEKLAILTTAIQAAVPSAVITSCPE